MRTWIHQISKFWGVEWVHICMQSLSSKVNFSYQKHKYKHNFGQWSRGGVLENLHINYVERYIPVVLFHFELQ